MNESGRWATPGSWIPSFAKTVLRHKWIGEDNVRDHRAGTSDLPFQNTRKSGFACITLLSDGATRSRWTHGVTAN